MKLNHSHQFLENPIWVLLTLAIFTPLIESKSNFGTVYDVLTANGLPIGLLPNRVNEFKIDENGRFHVLLDQPCNAKFESELHYEKNISGTFSYGKISNFTGVEAQELFLWFPVNSIRVDVPSSGVIYFDVGVVFKRFALSLFESPPDCVSGAARIVSDSESRQRLQCSWFAKQIVCGLLRLVSCDTIPQCRCTFKIEMNGVLWQQVLDGEISSMKDTCH